MTATRTALRGVTDLVAARSDFDCNGTLSGVSGYVPNVGRLPSRYLDVLDIDATADDFYVVSSYHTPIAWYARGNWRVPNVRYSPTTSKHQNALGIVADGSVWRRLELWAHIGKVA